MEESGSDDELLHPGLTSENGRENWQLRSDLALWGSTVRYKGHGNAYIGEGGSSHDVRFKPFH